MKARFAAIASAVVLTSAAAAANAGQGDRVMVVDGTAEILLTYLDGGGAGNTNLLFLSSPFESVQIFSNKSDNAPFTFDPLPAGTELVFRLNSNVSDDWFTGPASRNRDSFAHAIVTDLGNNTVQVAFEDLPGGGDNNFADMVFSVTNATLAPVPEPETFALMLAGLGIVGWAGRRRSLSTRIV